MVKRIIYFGFLCLSLFAEAQTPEALFEEGNNLYRKEKFKEAVKKYLEIEQQQLTSPELYFNLGNCYYKMNQVAYSIYYYEKALKLNPLFEDAKLNLVFAKRMTINKIQPLPDNFWKRFNKKIIKAFHYNTWAVLGVLFSFLTVALFILYYLSVSSKRKLIFFNVSFLFLFFMIISVTFSAINQYQIKNTREAIIFSKSIEIRNAPTESGDSVFELYEGTKVFIKDHVDEWRKIKLADGKVGWILAKNLKEL